jgi:nucleotide-binding universal stress UspA family protein
MYGKVLIPLDGSTLAENALEPAFRIAQHQQSEVILATVPVFHQVLIPGSAGFGLALPDQTYELCREEAETYLEQIGRTRAASGLTIRRIVPEGDVAGAIVDLAIEEQVDLIVMTTHGYSGFTRWMLGSITDRVLRGAHCPVLVVRCDRPFDQILITLDGSALSEQALQPGLELARAFDSRVTLLRVDPGQALGRIELGLLEIAGQGLSKPVAEQDRSDRITYYLDNIALKPREGGMDIETVLLEGSPAGRILEYLETKPVDLLVMATHGHTGLRRWVYGSVTQKCLNNSACAMLIVRPPAEVYL